MYKINKETFSNQSKHLSISIITEVPGKIIKSQNCGLFTESDFHYCYLTVGFFSPWLYIRLLAPSLLGVETALGPSPIFRLNFAVKSSRVSILGDRSGSARLLADPLLRPELRITKFSVFYFKLEIFFYIH